MDRMSSSNIAPAYRQVTTAVSTRADAPTRRSTVDSLSIVRLLRVKFFARGRRRRLALVSTRSLLGACQLHLHPGSGRPAPAPARPVDQPRRPASVIATIAKLRLPVSATSQRYIGVREKVTTH